MAASFGTNSVAVGSCLYSNTERVLPGFKTVSKQQACVVISRQGAKGVPSITTELRSSRRQRSLVYCLGSDSEVKTVTKLGIEIVRNPPESKLSELGVRSWPKWGCPPSKFPWTYSSRETCYLLKGKVKVFPEGSNDEAVEISAGDLVVFPEGMSCTWDVSETVDKHYKFD